MEIYGQQNLRKWYRTYVLVQVPNRLLNSIADRLSEKNVREFMLGKMTIRMPKYMLEKRS